MVTASRILGDEVGSTAPAFLAVLAVHVIAAPVITHAIIRARNKARLSGPQTLPAAGST
jgi:hypothetical protein